MAGMVYSDLYKFQKSFGKYTCPVMYVVSAKKQTASATSRALPYLPSGIKDSIPEFCFLKLEVISVSMNPGATMFTRIFRDATSFASDLVKPTRPVNKIEKHGKFLTVITARFVH